MQGISHSVRGPAGNLQLLVESHADREPQAVAVICHPHPLYGGSLKNKVVHQLARSFLELGAVSVRFNFRGVGDSAGRFDRGEGELEDLAAVVDWSRQRWPGPPLWLGGFSFGAAIALIGAVRFMSQWLVTVAPAIRYLPADVCSAQQPDWLLIQAGADHVVPVGEVLEWLERLRCRPRLVVLEGADHFFHGRLTELRRAVLRGAASASVA